MYTMAKIIISFFFPVWELVTRSTNSPITTSSPVAAIMPENMQMIIIRCRLELFKTA